MLDDGIYLPPSQFEANFLSIEHKKEDLDRTTQAVRKALARIN
jgi:glutamate-1-semialdehyde 2,1-aminomutase